MREVDKLSAPASRVPETGWIRTWLDTVLDLPWSVRTEDTNDVAAPARCSTPTTTASTRSRTGSPSTSRWRRRAERGLEVVGGRGSGAVVLLAGPPGVGKTSLGESVPARWAGSFVRVALGGVRDEAEIRGHRRTYVGALPGRIVRAIKEAGSMNPVVLLDEVDKVGADYRGDPAAALLEVLDPAQNQTFRDHYLELDLDLSDVLFIATANVVEQIPSALLDRMELITIDGYTEDDKVAIARDFLVPRQLERAALTPDEVTVSDDALGELAANYTREAGVRQLERLLAKAFRKAATRLATGEGERLDIDRDAWRTSSAGPLHPRQPRAHRGAGCGDRSGRDRLGGDVLSIESRGRRARRAHDHRPARRGDEGVGPIALSWVRPRRRARRRPGRVRAVDPRPRPGGAVPKGRTVGGRDDGDRARLAAHRTPGAPDVGMTGEVTLNGRVLPSAAQAEAARGPAGGADDGLRPGARRADLDDVPAELSPSSPYVRSAG